MKKVIIWFGLFFISVLVMFLIAKILGVSVWLTESLLLMVGLHELGHLGMAKFLGYRTKGFYFLPGLGGVALLDEIPKKRFDCFLIWYMGPFVGMVVTIILIDITFLFYPSVVLLWKIAGIWAVINLFNLLPVIPLDGGMIDWSIMSDEDEDYLFSKTHAIFKYGSLFLILMISIPFGVLIWFFGKIETEQLIRDTEEKKGRLPMSHGKACMANYLYVALVCFLLYLTLICSFFIESIL